MNKPRQNKKNDSSLLLNNSLAFESFMEQAKNIVPADILKCSLEHFQEETELYNKATKRFAKAIKETPLLATFLDWIQSKEPYDIDVENASILMESGLIQFIDAKGKYLKVSDVRIPVLRDQIDLIRCQKKYSIRDRELFVRTFLSFFKWLSINTGAFIPQFDDPDEERTDRRALTSAIVISFACLSCLTFK